MLILLPTLSFANAERPNILFILSDDQTFSALGINNKDIITPNLDRLATRGTQFTHVYNQGSWSPAVCSSSRAMINTGRNLYSTGMMHKERPAKQPFSLWGETFRQAGYETFISGKWHLSDKELERSFDIGQAVLHTVGMTQDHYQAPMVDLDLTSRKISQEYPSKKHTSELITDKAIDYLKSKKGRNDKPFFMYLGYLAPHDPRQSPQNFLDMYSSDDIALPDSFLRNPTIDHGERVRGEGLLSSPRKVNDVKQFIAEYYAMMTHLDAEVGRLLNVLGNSQYADNTLIIFTSDHGLAVGKHALLGKQNQYEHSIRAPFIIAGKNIKKGRKAKGGFYLNSLFPTTAELAGIPIPSNVQAKSFASLLKNTDKNEPLNEYVYGAYRHYQRMVRSEDFKLIYYPITGVTQLFDLKKDPKELHNVVYKPELQKELVHLKIQLSKLMDELDDPLDFDAPESSYIKASYPVNPYDWKTYK